MPLILPAVVLEEPGARTGLALNVLVGEYAVAGVRLAVYLTNDQPGAYKVGQYGTKVMTGTQLTYSIKTGQKGTKVMTSNVLDGLVHKTSQYGIKAMTGSSPACLIARTRQLAVKAMVSTSLDGTMVKIEHLASKVMTGISNNIGLMAKTGQYAKKSMTGFWWTTKVAQLSTKAMTGITGSIGVIFRQGQMPVKQAVVWPTCTMIKIAQSGIKAMSGSPGFIGSMVKVGQYGVAAKTGYFAIYATMVKTLRNAIKVMTGSISLPAANFVTVSMHTERQALTTYSNYQFNSYCEFNGKFYGASDAGLFELTGATDNGVAISSVARVGISDFGSPYLKSIAGCYLNYRTDGAMVLRVIINDTTTYEYAVPSNSLAGLHPVRVDVGRGIVARNMQFEIANVAGAGFSLDSLEVVPNILSRRV